MRDRAEKRRVLKVSITNAIPVFQTHAGDPILMIQAVNPGNRTVHVAGSGYKIGRKGFALFQPMSDVKFPHALDEGKSCSVWVDSKDVARQLKELGHSGTVRIVGYFQDAVGTQYRSKPLKFAVDEWLAAKAG